MIGGKLVNYLIRNIVNIKEKLGPLRIYIIIFWPWTIDHDEVDGLRQEYFDDEDELNDADEDDKATDEKETPGEKGLNMKDNPLDRRALQSLEKQLSLEPPESKFDLSVSNSLKYDHIFVDENSG